MIYIYKKYLAEDYAKLMKYEVHRATNRPKKKVFLVKKKKSHTKI